MKLAVKSKMAACVLVLVMVALSAVIGGDVVVKEGTIEGEIFKSTDCTAVGTRAVAFGEQTIALGDWSTSTGYGTSADGLCGTAMGYCTAAPGDYSTSMGYETTAYGLYSTSMGWSTAANGDGSAAMGILTTASGSCSVAMGMGTKATGGASMAMGQNAESKGHYSTAIGYSTTAGPAMYTFALGKSFTNNVQDSFAVGFGSVDFRVESVTAGEPKVNIYSGDLRVEGYVYSLGCRSLSSFYDKDKYGRALDHSEDNSRTIKLSATGEKEYNHEADPVFLQAHVTVKDYDKYTEKEVWNEELQCNITRRIYQTHQELASDESMKVAWLRQCVFELKQENGQLKSELAAIKAKLGME